MDSVHSKLECAKVLYYFEKISEIPRGSGNEKSVSDYLVDFAEKNGFWVKQDNAFNVIIKVPASKGKENFPPVIIQGHMDMVCEKEKDSEHDFSKDGIKLIYDSDVLTADGTTLGGDDGIAVAMAMSLAVDENAVHPPLEIVITTDEEVGMCGANALDTSVLKGRILLNIDSEEEGVFTTACAGGLKPSIFIPFEKIKNTFERSYSIDISGLKGGHSGIDIDKGRANANKLMGEILKGISEYVFVSEISGGAKDNAIPRYAHAVVSFEAVHYDNMIGKINEIVSDIKKRFSKTDPNIKILISETEKRNIYFDKESTENMIDFICRMPCGVITMSEQIEGLPESSNNLGIITTEENSVKFVCALRSSDSEKKTEIKNTIKELAEKANGKFEAYGDYPAWEYNENSYIRELCLKVYKELYDKDAKADIVHAGLECGIFASKVPDMDMISFGPNLYDIHTPNERLIISSANRMWVFLLKLLEKIYT